MQFARAIGLIDCDLKPILLMIVVNLPEKGKVTYVIDMSLYGPNKPTVQNHQSERPPDWKDCFSHINAAWIISCYLAWKTGGAFADVEN